MLKACAIAGGALASTSLAVSATAAAGLTTGPGRDTDRARSLHRFLFAAGGPVHGGGLALLLGALGLAELRTGALPRPLAIATLAAAGVTLWPHSCSLSHGLHWSSRPGGSLAS
jgi:hypothetical protein